MSATSTFTVPVESDGTRVYKGVQHANFAGTAAHGAVDQTYQSVIIRAKNTGGVHDRVDLDDYTLDIIVRPRFEPYWLRGKYNRNCVIYVDTPEKAKRDHPGDAWELVEIKEK